MYQWDNYSTQERQRLMNLQLGREEQWKYDVMQKTYASKPEYLDPFNNVVDEASAYLSSWIEAALQEEMDKRLDNASKNRLPEWTYQIFQLGPDRIAYIFIRNLMEAVYKSSVMKDMDYAKNIYALPLAQGLARDVGQSCWDICRWLAAKDDSYGWYKKQTRFFKSWTYKRRRAFMNKVNALPELSLKDKDKFGHVVIRIAEQAGIIETQIARQIQSTKSKGKVKKRKYIMPAAGLVENMYTRIDEYLTQLLPNRLPMVCRPVDHLKNEAGGLMDWSLRKMRKTAKTRAKATEEMFVNSFVEVDPSCMSDTTRTVINALQRTEYKINVRVLDVMTKLWKANRQTGGLPAYDVTNIEQMSPYPEEGTNDEKHQWMIKKEQMWSMWHKGQALRLQQLLRVSEAGKIRDFVIWFAYFCDFRGRYYSDSYLLHPQGGDLDRGLLMFAHTHEVDADDIYWIKINLANLMGFDKASFDDRAAWVDERILDWREVNDNPEGTIKIWEDESAQKNSSFQRLAAIFDLIMALDEGKSRIAVQLDGSCNGIQHWAALTRDEVVGEQVNLTANDKPQDIYQLVADGCTELCGDDPTGWKQTFLDHWEGTIPRKVCKRSVMCDPYGISPHSVGSYVLHEGHLDWIPGHNEKRQAMDVMRKLICEAKDEKMEHCNHGKQLVTLLAGWLGDTPMSWVTPSGFLVINKYRKPVTEQNAVRVWNKQFALNFQYFNDEHHNKKARSAMSPNFVHSLDAAHMTLVITELLLIGCVYLSFIHDSFGVPAPFIKQLRAIIKEKFHAIHSEDLLEQLIDRAEDIMGQKLPAEHPIWGHRKRGKLDINSVLEADYLFG